MQRKPFLLIQIIPRDLRSGQYKIQAAGCRLQTGYKMQLHPGYKTWTETQSCFNYMRNKRSRWEHRGK